MMGIKGTARYSYRELQLLRIFCILALHSISLGCSFWFWFLLC